MKKWLKRIVILLLTLVVLLVIGAAGLYVSVGPRLSKVYNIPTEALTIPTDQAANTAGEHVALIRGCMECHGPDLAGQVLINSPTLGVIVPKNLTKGQGGVGGSLTDSDWARAIRHGLRPDGTALLLMPSAEFYGLTDVDLSNLIAYLKSRPHVDKELPPSTLGPLGRILLGLGSFPALSAEAIDHTAPRPDSSVTQGVTIAHGKYLARVCTGCHGPGFSGGPFPFQKAGSPPARNLTPAGDLAQWSQTDFINFFQSGVTPSGEHIRAEFMPWPEVGQMTNDELKSVFLYLQSLPPKPTGNR